ncbi:hypothetical protein RFI_26890 [Reticulomyxa filosa]|uniref:Uncharacterized protein n=1 Tax=Reticulomyxa filosa TaxID=46433 RepID=X6M9D7_RETFI|nr:hypothetical protein RFI_26890 [Reticulomyxa filosa]|eukprot:ETO10489.1 hypothetical protein RFI_26890 [Reticulomyxa filosa]
MKEKLMNISHCRNLLQIICECHNKKLYGQQKKYPFVFDQLSFHFIFTFKFTKFSLVTSHVINFKERNEWKKLNKCNECCFSQTGIFKNIAKRKEATLSLPQKTTKKANQNNKTFLSQKKNIPKRTSCVHEGENNNYDNNNKEEGGGAKNQNKQNCKIGKMSSFFWLMDQHNVCTITISFVRKKKNHKKFVFARTQKKKKKKGQEQRRKNSAMQHTHKAKILSKKKIFIVVVRIQGRREERSEGKL